MTREYSAKIIDTAFERVKAIPREEALKKVTRNSQSDRETCVITYHPLLLSVAKVIKTHHQVMTDQSQPLKRYFNKPSLVAYKRHKNLGDILVKAKVYSKRRSERSKNGFGPCQRVCTLCKTNIKTSTHSCNRTGRRWDIKSPINCVTDNVIYKLLCRKCPDFLYIGETKRRFCDRVQEHRGAISQKKTDHPVGAHFNQEGVRHSVIYLVAVAIERVLPRNNTAHRKQREHG